MTEFPMDNSVMVRFRDSVAEVFPFQEEETFEAYCDRAITLLNPSQRAMLLARLDKIVADDRAKDRAKKNDWIAAARLAFAPARKQPCRVCGKFRDVAEAHHIIPLASQYDRGFDTPDHSHVWLCPTHHAIMHLFIGPEYQPNTDEFLRKRGRATAGVYGDLSNEEINILFELLHQSGRGR